MGKEGCCAIYDKDFDVHDVITDGQSSHMIQRDRAMTMLTVYHIIPT